MCGINGFNWKDEKLIKEMNNEIKHRGPDNQGTHYTNKISIGQVRLSILDLTPKGNQPQGISEKNKNKILFNKELEDAKYSIVFNGEIYNFKEIKKELKEYTFETNSDTEVILKAYDKWGEKCVDKFNGMWAFCIYNQTKEELFCSRDRLGVKPFYYYHKKNKFVFSSELKGIIKNVKNNKKEEICEKAIELYFCTGFIPSPLTIFKDTYKLEPGHNLIFNLKTNKLTKTKYYEIPEIKSEKNKKELIKEGKELLFNATKLRMISDVPVGAFLSGGIDSSSVVKTMSVLTNSDKLNTFSIGFEGKYDESKYIKLVQTKIKTKHHHKYFLKKDFKKLIKTYSEMYDEPFADYSGFPTQQVCALAKKQVTVSLSGDGGDEIFGGYNTHIIGKQMELIKKIPKPIRKLISKIPFKKKLNGFASAYLFKEACKLSLEKNYQFYTKALIGENLITNEFKKWSEKNMKYCLKKSKGSLSEALRIYDLLFNTLGDKFLVKVDRASMNQALEVRSPFLDYRFIEFGQKIPSKWKTSLFQGKILLKEIVKDLIPEEIIKRKKQGFEPPIDKWIMEKDFDKKHEEGLNLIKELNQEIHKFYKNKVNKSKDKLYVNYKIKLFIFNEWWNRWIQEKDI